MDGVRATAGQRAEVAGQQAELATERVRLGRERHDVLAYTLGAEPRSLAPANHDYGEAGGGDGAP